MSSIPSQKVLQSLFHYIDGELLWKKAGRGRKTGAVGYNGERYKCIVIYGTTYKLHRVIYSFFHGEIKEGNVINHLDGNSFNNNIDNLELTTQACNVRHGLHCRRDL